jgi:hypothetical protein
MMDFDWKSVVRTVAPGLATALGGPLAGVAASALSDALLGRPDGSESDISQAMAIGGADALVKIKAAEQAFQVRMRELDIDLERVHQADRDGARQREAGTGDTLTPRMLAIGITVGFFGVLGWLLTQGKPETGGDALLVMLGALGGAWASVVAYYFGSSAGSREKTALLGGK